VKILFLGDVVGRPGRSVVARRIPMLRQELKVDFVIANAENAAAGAGITGTIAKSILESGVDAITLGDHVWDQKEIIPYMSASVPLLPSGISGSLPLSCA